MFVFTVQVIIFLNVAIDNLKYIQEHLSDTCNKFVGLSIFSEG